jgi:hypothetical protein
METYIESTKKNVRIIKYIIQQPLKISKLFKFQNSEKELSV